MSSVSDDANNIHMNLPTRSSRTSTPFVACQSSNGKDQEVSVVASVPTTSITPLEEISIHSSSNCSSNGNDTTTSSSSVTEITSSSTSKSNEQLLIIAFVSFLCFAIVQMIFAIYIAHSHAMIGDSSVMFIDAFTYLCNGYSERKKQYFNKHYNDQVKSATNPSPQYQKILSLELRQSLIALEIIAPSISVMALMIVTILITKASIQTLNTIEQDEHNISNELYSGNTSTSTSTTTTTSNHEQPNLYIILSFSTLNLLLDLLNMYFFTKPKLPPLYCCSWFRRFRRPTATNVIMDSDQIENSNNGRDGIMMTSITTTRTTSSQRQQPQQQSLSDQSSVQSDHNHHNHHHQGYYHTSNSKKRSSHHHHHNHNHNSDVPRNLNLCSAYTHVLADTLRSIAVITAVVLALLYSIEPRIADATAALIVSFLIALSCIPLLQGLYYNIYEYLSIKRSLRQLLSTTHQQHDLHLIEVADTTSSGYMKHNGVVVDNINHNSTNSENPSTIV